METYSLGSVEKTIFASPPPKFNEEWNKYRAPLLEEKKSARSLEDVQIFTIREVVRKFSLDMEFTSQHEVEDN